MARSGRASASTSSTKRKLSRDNNIPAAKVRKRATKRDEDASKPKGSKANGKPTAGDKMKDGKSKLDSPYFASPVDGNSKYFTEAVVKNENESQQKSKAPSKSIKGKNKETNKLGDKEISGVNVKQNSEEIKQTRRSVAGSSKAKSMKDTKSSENEKVNKEKGSKNKQLKTKSSGKADKSTAQKNRKEHSKSPNKSTKKAVQPPPSGSPQKMPMLSTPMELLLQAEGNAYKPHVSAQDDDSDDEMISGSDESDWEDVEEVPEDKDDEAELQNQVPDAPVEVTLTGPDIMRKKRKRGFDIADWFRRKANRHQKEMQLDVHKAHLLCLLCHGFHRNNVCNNEILRGIALSIAPHEFLGRSRSSLNIQFYKDFTRWFYHHYYIEATLEHSNKRMKRTLGMRLSSRAVASEVEMVMLYVILLRALGAQVRLVYSLQPVSHKPSSLKLKKKEPDLIDLASRDSSPAECSSQSGAKPQTSKLDTQPAKKSKQSPGSSSSSKGKRESKSPSSLKSKDLSKSKTPSKSKDSQTPAKRNARRNSSGKSYKEDSDEDDEKPGKSRGKASKKKTEPEEITLSSDSDFEAEKTYRSPPSTKKHSRKVVSSDSDDSVQVTKSKVKEQGSDWWVEAYAEVEKKWICEHGVDCVRWRFNHPSEFQDHATTPVYYVVAYDNDNSAKDVTMRYATDWLSKTRKLRPDSEWWAITMLPYKSHDWDREEGEDLLLQAQHLQKPLPTSIGEYKNHPLYALPRHLLKFEAIYPDTAVPVGYIRKEPVYARECVHVLHTRENWLKEARAVRVNEQPYKFVKGRKKKRAPMDAEDPVAELFGRWQTEQYIPPPAHDGKVPRNEYGNVELFKPCMLPAGTVHLRVPALNKVAKKLGIDCAAAMTGWDHHSGYAHPILDGWIVCEEFEDTLMEAWEEDQLIQVQKEAEKKQKRVLDNWKKLIRGLIIREKMKKRFNLLEPEKATEPSTSKSPGKSKSKSKSSSSDNSEKAKDMEVSWPRNRQTEPVKVHHRDQGEALFPFEKL